MEFLDSIQSGISQAIDTVKETVSETVETVEEKASQILSGSIWNSVKDNPSQTNSDVISYTEEAEIPDYQMEILSGDNNELENLQNEYVEAQEQNVNQNQEQDESIVTSAINWVSNKISSLNPFSNANAENEAYTPIQPSEINSVDSLTKFAYKKMRNTPELIQKMASVVCNVYNEAKSTYIKFGLPINTDELGRTQSISSFTKLDNETFNAISNKKHGERLDSSLADYKIKIGDKEVKFITDNNIVSSEWAKQNGIPENGTVLSVEKKQVIEDALKIMQEHGQTLPDEIYFTNMIGYDKKTEEKIVAGLCSTTNPSALFINSELVNDNEFLKYVIYHESSHMKDFSLGNGNIFKYLSDKEDIDISPISNEKLKYDSALKFHFGDKQIKKMDIDYFLSPNISQNPQLLTEKIDEMIKNGAIVKDNNGKYTINIDKYKKTSNVNSFFSPKNEFDLNNLMNLYKYIKENNIKQIEYKQDPDPNLKLNIIEFNGKEINKGDIARLISEYSLTNNHEFVAEVSAMITDGTIIQDKDGHYTLTTNEKGEYRNAKYKIFELNENDIKALNDIMEMYNHMTNKEITTANVLEQ